MKFLVSLLGLPQPVAGNARVITYASIIGVISITLFLDTQIVALVGAAFWAVTGILHLPAVLTTVLAIAVAIPVLWACVAVAILVFNAETDPANNQF